MNHNPQTPVEGGRPPTRIYWLAMLASQFVYLAVGLAIGMVNAPFRGVVELDAEVVSMLRAAFLLIAIVIVLSIGLLRRALSQQAPARSPQTLAILTYALCDVPGLLGLILYLLSGRQVEFLTLLGISVSALIFYIPRNNPEDGEQPPFA